MLLFLGIVVTLVLSAVFSGSEMAYVSANKLRVELKKKRGSYRSVILTEWYNRPAAFISTMLVGNNIVLVIFTTLMAIPLEQLMSASFGLGSESALSVILQTLLITIIVLIFGEFMPKTIFRLYADDLLYTLAVPVRVMQFILAPAAWFMTKTSDLLLKIFDKNASNATENALTRLDLEAFVKESRSDEDDTIDKELFGKALNLREIRVRESMVPRTEVEFIDANSSVQDLIALFEETKLSRVLVVDEDIDNVLGYVHHQQLFSRPADIRSIIMDIPFVPEAMKVMVLMNAFIKDNTSIACVVDEFGGTAGIITLEDILEEIFGEIEDEHDDEDYVEERIGEHEYLFSGRLEIDYLNQQYGFFLPDEGEYHTLSGYLVVTNEKIPAQGEVLRYGDYEFTIESVSNTRIETVRMVCVNP